MKKDELLAEIERLQKRVSSLESKLKKQKAKELLPGDDSRHDIEYWLEEAQRAGKIGIYSIDYGKNVWYCSSTFNDIFGIDEGYPKTFDSWMNLLAPSFRNELTSFFTYQNKRNNSFEKTAQIRKKNNGNEIWVYCRGEIFFDEKGKLLKISGTIKDIDNMKKSEEERISHEKMFRGIIEASAEWIWIVDANGLHTYSNNSFKTLLGYEASEIIGVNALPFVHKDEYEKIKSKFLEQRKNPTGWTGFVLRWLHKDGTIRFLESNAKPLYDASGNFSGFIGAERDITKRIQSEEEMRRWKQRYDIITAASSQVVYDYDYISGMVTWGGSVKQVLGYSPDEMNGHIDRWMNLLHLDDLKETLRVLNYAQSHSLSMEIQYRIRHKDGQYIDILDRGIPMLDTNGKAVRLIGMMEDITERRHDEEKMKIKDRAIESSINAIAMADLNGLLTYVNPSFLEIWGYNQSDELLGSPVNKFWLEPDAAIDILTSLKIHGLWVGELVGIKKDTTLFYLEMSASMVYDDRSMPLYMFGAFVDITERKLAEIALKEKTDEIELYFTTALDLFCIADMDGYFKKLNNAWETTLGYSIDKLINRRLIDFIHPDDFGITVHAITQLVTKEGIVNLTNRYRCSDGSYRWIEWRMRLHGKMMFAAARDITERKLHEDQLQQYRDIVSRMQVGLYVYRLDDENDDLSLRMVSLNPMAVEMFKRPAEQAIGKRISELKFQNDASDISARFADVVRTGVGFEVSEFNYIYESFGNMWFSFKCFPLPDNCVGVLFDDITDRKLAEENIKNSLVEKEALLRELYHRTKNNMQVICALMQLQSAHENNAHVTEVFQEMENRIRSMSLVHQKLYQSGNLSSIDIKEYVTDLAKLLLQSYKISPEKVTLNFDIESIFLMIDTAVPCGLIINELVSNSFKHGIADGREGMIAIDVRRNASGEIELIVSDNGVGVPDGFDFRKEGRMGVQTIFAIGEHQLQGSVTFNSSNGVRCVIVFPYSGSPVV